MDNPRLDLAYNFVLYTDRNIFLTGKAGTGKTTFLQRLKADPLKRMVIVAPTGVAAINAGGTTIHSFFQLPFGPYLSREAAGHSGGSMAEKPQRFNRDKINLLKSLDLLVIDEISMVRADTLDGIDEVLRKYRDRSKPFGGVQLLMIGDLHQLSPVVKEEDWKLLRDYYPHLYFFSSRALSKAPAITIELTHIYRQTDDVFIGLLNAIRENRLSAENLELLNSRYLDDFSSGDDEGYITLTTHNRTADAINDQRLGELDSEEHRFNASVSGDFPDYAYPAAASLLLKIGAQVMFVKNDPTREKRFYNGKIGRVTGFGDDLIQVTCGEDEIDVVQAEWRNVSYSLNDAKEVEESVAGVFVQYPLRLAWAITIHKSQGLTFDRAIIDAAASFAHGQVYVALSRCRSFEGLVLRSPIHPGSVKTDGTVAGFSKSAEEALPGNELLTNEMARFQQSLIYELFDFTMIQAKLYHLVKLAREHDSSVSPSLIDEISALRSAAGNEIYPVAESFRKQLAGLFAGGTLPQQDPLLQDRLKKACAWFALKTAEVLTAPAEQITIDADNKLVRKELSVAMEQLLKELFVKRACMNACADGFDTLRSLKTRSGAELDFEESSTKKPAKKGNPAVPGSVNRPELYSRLKQWRDRLAAERNAPVYAILPIKTMEEISARLPKTLKELEAIKGIGKAKLKKHGSDLLEIISRYAIEIENT